MHIEKQKKDKMLCMLEDAEKSMKIFKSNAADLSRFVPQKLSSFQRKKIHDIAVRTGDILAKDLPRGKKYIKKHYTREEWQEDCKLVEDVLVIGTSKIVAHAQEIQNIINGEYGSILDRSLDSHVVPTISLAMKVIRQACDIINYTGICLDEAFHDDFDIIVDTDEIVPQKSWEHYKKALDKLDADMRKSYESKKKNLEKKYGDKIHRSVQPEMDYYVEMEGGKDERED